MCVGALVHARVCEVVYGTTEPKTGALVSQCARSSTPVSTIVSTSLAASSSSSAAHHFRSSSGTSGARNAAPTRSRRAHASCEALQLVGFEVARSGIGLASTADMEDLRLSDRVDTLARIEPTPLPLLSLYLNTEPNGNGRPTYETFLRKELTHRVTTYEERSAERESLERDCECVERYLAEQLQPPHVASRCSRAPDVTSSKRFKCRCRLNGISWWSAIVRSLPARETRR